MHNETVSHWLESFAASRLIRDDIHVDMLSFKEKGKWIRGAAKVLEEAREARSSQRLDVSLAIQFYLVSSEQPLLRTPSTLEELTHHLSRTPPALCVYAPSHEPWKLYPEAFKALDQALRPTSPSPIRVLFQEWFDAEEQDFDRRIWWTD